MNGYMNYIHYSTNMNHTNHTFTFLTYLVRPEFPIQLFRTIMKKFYIYLFKLYTLIVQSYIFILLRESIGLGSTHNCKHHVSNLKIIQLLSLKCIKNSIYHLSLKCLQFRNLVFIQKIVYLDFQKQECRTQDQTSREINTINLNQCIKHYNKRRNSKNDNHRWIEIASFVCH